MPFKDYSKTYYRNRSLKLRYGITQTDYEKILLSQGGGCAVCQTTITGSGKDFFDVDHNHTTGAVRGLLCRHCNITLGLLEGNRELVVRLEKYLAFYKVIK